MPAGSRLTGGIRDLLDLPQRPLHLPEHRHRLDPLGVEEVDDEAEAEEGLEDHSEIVLVLEQLSDLEKHFDHSS
jgi:hypothetical protein